MEAECAQVVKVVVVERQQLPLSTPQAASLGGDPGMPVLMRAASLPTLPRSANTSLLNPSGEGMGSQGAGQMEIGGAPPSVLGLRGVTPVGGSSRRYEVNLGQQAYGSGRVQWELWVENLGDAPLRYRLFPLTTEEGEEWLSFSRSSGTLTARHETQMITLDCSTQRLDIYSAYVLIENVDDPHDLKTVHVSMRVVVSDAPASNYFTVIVDSRVKPTPHQAQFSDREGREVGSLVSGDGSGKHGKDSRLLIDMGEVYYDVSYLNRSFVVQNLSSLPLDFLISHNLQAGPSATEVSFSLSNSALKVFSTLLVPPNSSTRVFVHLRTGAPRDGSASGQPSMGSTPALATRMKMRNLAVEISISCRLVKDHRKVIHLTAICHPPQLSLSHTDLTFSMPRLDASALHKGRGLLQPSGPALRIEPKDGAVIQVANLGGSPLKYAVRFSCCFFNVDASSEGEAIAEGKDGKILHTITVTPNERAIQSHLPFLAKARFVEEHFTVYNLADLSEHSASY